MRVLADYVGGQLDGRLEMLPDAMPEIRVPVMDTVQEKDMGEFTVGIMSISYITYIRDETPKALNGDIAIFAYRLQNDNG